MTSTTGTEHRLDAAAGVLPTALRLMGVNVTPLASYEQAVQCIARVVETGGKSFWAAINPQKMHRAWREPAIRQVLEQAQAGLCDGVGVSLAARILGGVRLRRVTGCDLFFHILPAASARGWRVFLLGASSQASRQAAENLQRQWPALRIVGRQDGFFRQDAEVIERINQARPDLLFVALGSPRQECWIARHMGAIDARFFMGVGGTLDVAAGLSRRAPRLLRAAGLEFLYQLASQPWRWRRQIVYIPFLLHVLGRRLSGRAIDQAPGGAGHGAVGRADAQRR